MKTIVSAKHTPGPYDNGVDGCQARAGNQGMCPGVAQAAWLNSLGNDDVWYLKPTTNVPGTTNLQVRLNWINHFDHLVVADAEMARLLGARLRARKEVAYLTKQIANLRKASVGTLDGATHILGNGPQHRQARNSGYRIPIAGSTK